MYFDEIRAKFVEDYREVIDGVVVAYLQDREEIEWTWAILNDAAVAAPSELSYPWDTPSRAGDFVMASQSAKVLPADRYVLHFRERDDFTGPTAGYHFKQLLVDGAVVWEEDVAGGPAAWRKVTVDVTEQVRGKTSVTLAFRLLDKKGVSNFGVRWHLSELRAENLQLAADLAEPQKWKVDRQGAFEAGFGGDVEVGPAAVSHPLHLHDRGRPKRISPAPRRAGHARAGRGMAPHVPAGLAGRQMRRRRHLLPGQAAPEPDVSSGPETVSRFREWQEMTYEGGCMKRVLSLLLISGMLGCISTRTYAAQPFEISDREVRISAGILERVIDLTNGNLSTTRLRVNGQELLAGPAAELSFTVTRAEPNARPKGLKAGRRRFHRQRARPSSRDSTSTPARTMTRASAKRPAGSSRFASRPANGRTASRSRRREVSAPAPDVSRLTILRSCPERQRFGWTGSSR